MKGSTAASTDGGDSSDGASRVLGVAELVPGVLGEPVDVFNVILTGAWMR